MTRRFALIAEHRSGSTYLMNALNHHGEVLCDNELFNHSGVVHYNPLGPNETDRETVWARNADPVGFMEAFHARRAGEAAAVGFNFMLGHDARVLMALVERGEDLILLSRENRLAQFASFEHGRATKKWATKRDAAAERQQAASRGAVQFHVAAFERWRQRQDSLLLLLEGLLARRGAGRLLRLDYAGLVGGAQDARICGFLGVSPAPLRSELRKQGASDILGRFANPDRAAAYIEAIGRPDWAEEEIS